MMKRIGNAGVEGKKKRVMGEAEVVTAQGYDELAVGTKFDGG